MMPSRGVLRVLRPAKRLHPSSPTLPHRFVSTQPQAPTISNIDTITLPTEVPQAVDPNTIGYLHSLGLDYGWGVTSTLQWTLEHIHVYTGLPWWATIASTALLGRLVLFPAYLKSADANARLNALGPIMNPLREKKTEALKRGDTAAQQQYLQEEMAVRKRAGITLRAQLAPAIFQGVFGFCGFKLIRAMAALPVPELRDGGFLWVKDLTLCDPYVILPLMMAGCVHVVARMGGESGVQNSNLEISPGMRAFTLYGLPGIVLLFMGWQPGALCVWFITTGSFGIAQAALLRMPKVRRFFKIAPIVKVKNSSPPESPFQDILKSFTEKNKQAQSGSHGLRYSPPTARAKGKKVIDAKAKSVQEDNSVAGRFKSWLGSKNSKEGDWRDYVKK
ncbi:hypothetical protein K470DRAFT_258363 [Piedraia hortae CBS 480.64]|uniref:Membrane insertase YidC/Oxa/ALB C-terminal domain-containing protein n=1 Tax=Piedraia hortae CBS 480.64 TaxID=1314780 RepID=A0A6A7BXR3_9PEZI|nr:hypothetical protein K470DRAFT_258363 [Piedraia hortae CBS 480.64]